MAQYIGINIKEMIDTVDQILLDLTSEEGQLFKNAKKAGKDIAKGIYHNLISSVNPEVFRRTISVPKGDVPKYYQEMINSTTSRVVVKKGNEAIRIKVGNVRRMSILNNVVGRWFDKALHSEADYPTGWQTNAERGGA